MDTKHTPGPWHLEGYRIEATEEHSIVPVATVYRSVGGEAEDAANGALLAAAPELLEELQRAELVIKAMLNLLTTRQKARMAKVLEVAGVAGEEATRHHERRAVIERATGATAQPRP